MKNLKDIITERLNITNNVISERLILSKNKQNSEEHTFDLTFNDFYEAMETYQRNADRPSFKAVYLWPITKTPKLLNFSYNAYLESVYIKDSKTITVQFLGRNKRKRRIYISNDEELLRILDETTIWRIYDYCCMYY